MWTNLPQSAMSKIVGLLAYSIFSFFFIFLGFSSLSVMAQQLPPTFAISFTPSTIGPGSSSLLTFTIDNTANSNAATDLAFTNMLPAGIAISSAPKVSTTCGADASIDAPPGGSTITFLDGRVAPGQMCQISLFVTSSAIGTHTNTTEDLTSNAGSHGAASADLIVTTDRPGFTKSFSPTTIDLGETSKLTFMIDNTANVSNVTSLDFTDIFPSVLVVADPSNANTTCGDPLIPPVLTAVPGSNTIALFANGAVSNPALALGKSCIVSLDVVATGSGILENISSELLSTIGNAQVNSGVASAHLEVTRGDPLNITKQFTNDPVPPGGTVDLEFTITNFNRNETVYDIAFEDDLGAALTGLAPSGSLPMASCGGTFSFSMGILSLAGGSLGPGESCTFTISCHVPEGTDPGRYHNTTGPITGTVNGEGVTCNQAEADLFVSDAPILTKSFLKNPVSPGETNTIRFTIRNPSSEQATNLNFADDLTQFIPGVIITMLPDDGFCGMGSSIVEQQISSVLTIPNLLMTGGSLAGGDICSFDVGIEIPVNVDGGTYTNTTGTISATISDNIVGGNSASADLIVVGGPQLSKRFIPEITSPGSLVRLEYTITMDDEEPAAATNIQFTDDLNAVLPGLMAVGLPLTTICGSGSITGTSIVSFTDGTVGPGESCTFSIEVMVPSESEGTYTSLSSDLSCIVEGLNASSGPALAKLIIGGALFEKNFLDILPDNSVQLKFNITNLFSTQLENLSFRDDLSEVLPGLVATVLPSGDMCGMGSLITGTNMLTFTGGLLGPGESCEFEVTLQIPANTPSGTYINKTGSLFSGSLAIGDPASDMLTVVGAPTLSKKFIPDMAGSGDIVTLEYTIQHSSDAIGDATGITFTDNLDEVLPGLVAAGLPMTDICGFGSSISGTSIITLNGGSLSPGQSCAFAISMQIPAGAALGTHTNITSDLTAVVNGQTVISNPAKAYLEVIENNRCLDDDADGDNVCGDVDNCPTTANPDQADIDCDGVGDVCDLCNGGDDSVDNNNDGFPDCAFPPSYDDIIAAWKCDNNKVYICHNINNNPKTNCVNINALTAHINHGDYLGPCGNVSCTSPPSNADTKSSKITDFNAFPNPFNEELSISLEMHQKGDARLSILSLTGQIIKSIDNIEVESAGTFEYKVDTRNIPNGFYFVEFTTPTGERYLRSVIRAN